MAQSFGKTLFVVSSPFQCLCMFEAIRYFDIKVFDVCVSVEKYSVAKVEELLKEKGVDYALVSYNHLIYDVLPFAIKKHKHYDNIFLGYYYGATDVALSYFFSSFHAQLYYLDDGIQAYSIFSEKPRLRFPQAWVRIAMKLYGVVKLCKLLPREKFFTIFDVSSDRYEIIHNSFSGIESNHQLEPAGVYVIGTNSSVLSFKNHSYNEMLVGLKKHIKQNYGSDNVYYCPHRRDANNDKIISWCQEEGVRVFDTRIAVEYDFATVGIYPKAIVGFNSNALYTLQMLFPKAKVFSVLYELENPDSNEESEIIRKRLSEHGIQSLKIC